MRIRAQAAGNQRRISYIVRRPYGELAVMAQQCAVAALVCLGGFSAAATPLRGQSASTADSTRLSAPPTADDGRAVGITQSISVTGTSRSYRVGATRVNEYAAPFSYRFTSPRLGVKVSGAALRLDAPLATLNAYTPVMARADVLLRVGDTLSVYGRTGSSPTTLDSLALRAIGATGTSVLDFSSQGLGVPANLGARGVFSFPVREIVLGLSGAVEHESRPGGSGAVYWQGTTVRGGMTAHALVGERSVSLSADVSYSNADSLAGRNQFPGGGAFGVTGDLSGPLDAAGRAFFIANLFYAHPFNNTRADQPTRLIPSGAFAGASSALLLEGAGLTWMPSLTVLRESSRASVIESVGLQQTKTSLVGSAWSIAGSLSVDVPLGRLLTFSPEVGAVGGGVSSTIEQTSGRVITRRGRPISTTSSSRQRDVVGGWWGSFGLSAKF